MSAKRYNVRMAGIGGQGVVTASHILSNGVVISGGHSSLVPFFGSEKRNAPVESYVRISNQAIYEIGEIIYPNVIMIFHPSVITLGKSYTMPLGRTWSRKRRMNSRTSRCMIPACWRRWSRDSGRRLAVSRDRGSEGSRSRCDGCRPRYASTLSGPANGGFA